MKYVPFRLSSKHSVCIFQKYHKKNACLSAVKLVQYIPQTNCAVSLLQTPVSVQIRRYKINALHEDLRVSDCTTHCLSEQKML
jgi:hypothetical protein